MVENFGNGVFRKDVKAVRKKRVRKLFFLILVTLFLACLKIHGVNISWFFVLGPILFPVVIILLVSLVVGFLVIRG